MKANEIRDYLAPRYQDLKFKGFQKVHFLLDGCLEEGVIMDYASTLDNVFYRVAYLDQDLNVVHKTVLEALIFECYELASHFIETHFELETHSILKHHLKVYAVIKASIEMELDDYLIYVFFNGPKTKAPAVNKQELITVNRWASKVLAMRNSQNKYFRDRNYADLTQSKALEKEVDDHMDAAIKSLSSITSLLM